MIVGHFTKLFDVENSGDDLEGEENPINFITNAFDDEDRELLVEPISSSEIWDILENCNKKKSPGPDGLTYEFYIQHFEMIKDDLVNLLNGYLSGNYTAPTEFTAGVVTLIPKKGDLTVLENHRPITLLNTDYKIFTKLLATRLQTKIDKLIGPGQSACIGNRSCTDNLKDIRRIFTRAIETKRLKGCLISVDLEKAFDKVNHEFLWQVLVKFGFPEQLINCIKKTLCSGHVTSFI